MLYLQAVVAASLLGQAQYASIAFEIIGLSKQPGSIIIQS